MSNRIVFATYGSLGDLHPYMAIAVELKQRGHSVAIATSEIYRDRVEAENLDFYPVRPDLPAKNTEEAQVAIKQAMDEQKGTEYVLRQLILPYLKDSYNDLVQALPGADLLITNPASVAGALIAEKTSINWISTVLAPISFLSAYDPPVLGNNISRIELGLFSTPINKLLMYLGKLSIFSWSLPIQELRAELGLSPAKDPFFQDQHSPDLVLALFSQVFAQPQTDWYKKTSVTGFPFYDRQATELSPELLEFIESGSPPIVFTLGSAAVNDAGSFYIESALAAKQLGCRAVLIIGEDTRNQLPENLLSADIVTFSYAPYSKIFPYASVIVHQGGVGTTAEALRSGRPMLVMPYSHDQPDNAARAERLGVARTIKRNKYQAIAVASELKQLLHEPKYAQQAALIGQQIRSEDGVKVACDRIEAYLSL
ncbi:glycosyltransferase [Chlorogloea sp. CCALA 695]|uniref:glycosyltransferase n=1 Tax=Chlorogloea sp. CCALA 695 TaxID=2107693 RepID=UPI000D063100|nr:glycosyltransferase [Chlorogloea sp. CCALA 695]PSB31532.1 glycosyltransferase [Chlorogloea sp. CCALA 695]